MKRIFRYITIFLFLILAFNIWSEFTIKSRYNYYDTVNICNNIFVEQFLIFKGNAMTVDSYSLYVTDSLKFKKFICTYDDYNYFKYVCSDSLIKIIKYEDRGKVKQYNILFTKGKEVKSIIEIK